MNGITDYHRIDHAGSTGHCDAIEAKDPPFPGRPGEKGRPSGRRTSQSLADDLANEYSMPQNERKAHHNIVIRMRTARRHLCVEIGRALPPNRTKQDIDKFLDRMEQLCRSAESGPSDEEFA